MEGDELQRKYNQIYLEIILRYKDYIEQNENLNVAELPKLITPTNENVITATNKVKSTFDNYSYNSNFLSAAKLAYEFVTVHISHVSLPIEFWLYPSDTIKCEAGDIFDKATLLCSMMIALGNPSTRVISSVKPNDRRFIVYCEFDDAVFAFDLDRGLIRFDTKEKLIGSLVLKENDDTTAYEFNDKMYESLV
ncbi:MAG: hypothetical protein KGH53_01555 [Candidatus Micrarchaeota archaeon]|nr:hypothetical protein [Candidatus Micrarchaeota archaeon]